jgi:hypothetical protein
MRELEKEFPELAMRYGYCSTKYLYLVNGTVLRYYGIELDMTKIKEAMVL